MNQKAFLFRGRRNLEKLPGLHFWGVCDKIIFELYSSEYWVTPVHSSPLWMTALEKEEKKTVLKQQQIL